jgi:NAD(P)-dependent dehydrogenase (short-subunit alcohol dehydrogenase family)
MGTEFANFDGKAVLITGGTRGIGRACALAFAKAGADVYVTHWWGNTPAEELKAAFQSRELPPPTVLEADVSKAEDTEAVLREIAKRHAGLFAFVSNVAFAGLVHSFDDLTERSLLNSMKYSTWPVVGHVLAARKHFGRAPRHVVAISSQGAESLHEAYDIAATCKAAQETLCRYLAHRLHSEGSSVNVVRTRFVDSDSLRATFGEEFVPFVERRAPGLFTEPAVVADAVVGLCSGLLDAMNGQILNVDGGAAIFDGFSRLFQERDRLPRLERK